MPIAPGTRLGRYRLTERAGAGGMSDVWKAEDETLHRTVAVKVILGPIGSDATYRERFLREARLVAGLEHPAVLPVYDYGTETIDGAESPFLVMPLVTGGSLKERIKGPVPPAQAISWLAAVASALDHAHAKGILHRDIKPGNVLMGAGDRPLLADFGLARAVESASGLTQTGTVLGTPLYMAPEQATGKALDARADQYALAVIAYEMLAGRVPFRADSPLAVLHQHVSVAPEPISRVMAGLPPEADAVMGRALAKSAADRFPTCAEFVASLAQALGVPLSVATTPLSVPLSAPSRPVPPPVPPPPSGLSQQATVISASEPRVSAMAAPASAAAPRRRGLFVLLPVGFLVAAAAVFFVVKQTRAPAPAAPQPAALPAPTAPATSGPTAIAATTSAQPSTSPETPTPAPVPEPTAVPTAAAASPAPTAEAPREPERTARGPAKRGPRGSYEDRFGEPPPRPAADEPALPRREPLVLPPALSADTTLGAAYGALDASRREDGRLTRADFVSAMGEARAASARRRTPDAAFLDSFARAGVAFSDGQRMQAWQLLRRAFEDDPGAASSRTLRFVKKEAAALGENPGPDAEWVMGLAFADPRGDLAEELRKAEERASSAAVAYAKALHAWARRDARDARREARRACDMGLREACGLAGHGE